MTSPATPAPEASQRQLAGADRAPPGPAALQTVRQGVLLIALKELRDNDLAEECAQETMSRLWQALRRDDRPIADVPAFARGIARHVIADMRRSAARTLSLDSVANSLRHALQPDPLLGMVARDQLRRVKAALAAIPATDRKVIELLFLEGLAPTELARRQGVPPERLRKQKSRALRRLRQAFFGHDDEPAPTDDQEES